MALGKLYALCKLSPSVITFIRQSILHAFDEEDLECLEQKNFRAVERGTERGRLLPGGGGGTPLRDPNGDVRPDRVWFSGCFVLNGVSISSLSVLNRVSLHELMA